MATNQTHPHQTLQDRANEWNMAVDQEEFALKMDQVDPLRRMREEFCYPLKKTLPRIDRTLIKDDEECVYLCGNSLGLQPKGLKSQLQQSMDDWSNLGVYGHLNGTMPWAYCDEYVNEDSAKLVGAYRDEVAIMNGLSVNLHLLMISFYRPTATRHKILLEKHAFPSDHYVVESQIRFHGYDPAESMVFWEPRKDGHLLVLSDLLSLLEEQGQSIAVILLPGVQYYTGQLLDMETITKAGQDKGCYVGWDLAHAVGNVKISLHQWNADFASWCSYKYLNTGAGGIAGIFIHRRHSNNDFPKLIGWWGHKMSSRFQMTNDFESSTGADVYRVSNPPILLCAALRASLDVFNKTSIDQLRQKSVLLTGYLELLLQRHLSENVNKDVCVYVITPSDPEERGCQLSLKFSISVTKVFEELTKRGVVLDKREPDTLRVAPTPLYNSFLDVYKFIQLLRDSIRAAASQ